MPNYRARQILRNREPGADSREIAKKGGGGIVSQHGRGQVQIYIGAPVELASERAVIERIVQLLDSAGQSAIILANISIRGQQVDTVVATGSLVLIVEAKGFNRPVKGSENGPWQVQLASGQWKDFRNPYLQARDAALTLRDAMRAFAGADTPYPAAAAVFVPVIPLGSQPHPGDFKVSIAGLNELKALFQHKRAGMWPIERWQEFAKYLRLTPVSSVAAACGRALADAEALLQEYSAAYNQTYTDSETVVPFACHLDGCAESSTDVVRQIAEGLGDFVVRGPSGCGKTLLAVQAGRAFASRGGVAITLPIKDYTGSLKALLDREVGLLTSRPATNLLGSARRANRPLLLIVDGYNECAPSEQPSLTRGLAALARTYEAALLVTSQNPLARSDLLALRTVEVAPATPETKTAIALNASGGTTLAPELTQLLDSVATGLEARLVGEVGREIPAGSSRYILFDQFARKRLVGAATEGIALLSRIAGWLSDRIAFSLSIRDLDRLLEEHHVAQALGQRVRGVGLLTQRGERISFVHEMFLDAFVAEHIVRAAAGSATEILRALAAPRNANRQALILGAIEDDKLLMPVLDGLTGDTSVAACLAGKCGVAARKWAERQNAALWDRLRAEVLDVRFRISDRGWNNIEFDEATLTPWTPSERSFLSVMSQQVVDGDHLEDAFEIVGALDRRIAVETSRLRDEAHDHKISLRSAIFAVAYVGFSGAAPSITNVCSGLHGRLVRTVNDAVAETIRRRLTGGDVSPGQLYLLLMLSRGADIAAPIVTAIIKRHWTTAPYHLRLDLLDAARMCWEANDEERLALLSAIEALPYQANLGISGIILDVLAALGGLKASERDHVAVVCEEIKQCLAAPHDSDACARAYGLYSAQGDHPYASAYCEVIADLPEGERKALFAMAANGAQESAFLLAPLLMELASFNDPGVGDSIARWTALPSTDCFIPQDAIAVFVIAHVALARLGCALPEQPGEVNGGPAQALVACGEILYWCNRTNLDHTAKWQSCDRSLRKLIKDGFNASLNVIRHCERAHIEGVHRFPGESPVELSILKQFSVAATDICRRALGDADSQIGYFQHYFNLDRTKDLTFAISTLAHHGDRADLSVIKKYADDQDLGQHAINGVRTLEERLGLA